uniref:ABC transporter domain-containing protein n=1 Tax=Steinernema glaseri TaxID=37863 RepID=A0A1I7Z2S6_9BILA
MRPRPTSTCSKTDALIQQTIRKRFASSTVLTIAHRLKTIMDSDRVMVMEHGRLVECDHPHILLQEESSYFSFLVSETGKAAPQLKEIARAAFAEKTGQAAN